MLDDLRAVVEAESFSSDLDAVADCATVVATIGERLLTVAPERIVVDGRTHLSWVGADPRVLVVGHIDTVWPIGTLQRKPFRVENGIAYGPGVFDMKAGVVQLLHALALRPTLDGVAILLTGDEELGSLTSRALIEKAARGVEAVLVAEPSVGGSLKSARSGISRYRVQVTGKAAHVGLDPDSGANALMELASQLQRIEALSDVERGTRVTPTRASAGTATNVIPGEAHADIDVRASRVDEQKRVDRELHALTAGRPDTSIRIDVGAQRPPFEEAVALDLVDRAEKVAARLGLGALGHRAVGGGSDGNFSAALGIPTLDGLGPVGHGAHAEDEHVLIDHMPPRAALLSALVGELVEGD